MIFFYYAFCTLFPSYVFGCSNRFTLILFHSSDILDSLAQLSSCFPIALHCSPAVLCVFSNNLSANADIGYRLLHGSSSTNCCSLLIRHSRSLCRSKAVFQPHQSIPRTPERAAPEKTYPARDRDAYLAKSCFVFITGTPRQDALFVASNTSVVAPNLTSMSMLSKMGKVTCTSSLNFISNRRDMVKSLVSSSSW